MNDLLTLVNQLYQARLTHTTAKEALLAARRNYDQQHGSCYIQFITEGHYKALHLSKNAPVVQSAQLALDEATLRLHRTHVEIYHLLALLSLHKLHFADVPDIAYNRNDPD